MWLRRPFTNITDLCSCLARRGVCVFRLTWRFDVWRSGKSWSTRGGRVPILTSSGDNLGRRFVLFNAYRRSVCKNGPRLFEFLSGAVNNHHELISFDLSFVFNGTLFRYPQANQSRGKGREPPNDRRRLQGADQCSQNRSSYQ